MQDFPFKNRQRQLSLLFYTHRVIDFGAVILRQTQIFFIYEIRAACTRLWYVMAGIPETLDM